MKLGVWLMTATVANGESSRGPEFKDVDPTSRSGFVNPMFSIQAALSKIKNGFNRPQFVEYQREHEQLYKEVSSSQTRSDPEFIMAQAAELDRKFRSEPEGKTISKFPSMDGSGNDLTGQKRGQVGDGYSRLVPAEYCVVDKKGNPSTAVQGEPRCISDLSSVGNYVALPNEREISLLLAATNDNGGEVTMDEKRTMVGPLWGQFVTHDIIQTPDVPDPRECACEGTDDICKAVEIPLDDPIFTDRDVAECMIIKRSAPHISSEGAFVREQMNQKSAFMDLSQVYGSTEFELSQLRDDDGMHLKSRRGMLGGPHGNQGTGDLLAFTQDSSFLNFTQQFVQHSTFNDDNFKDFIAGDNRVEENPYLASFTTIFMRYHNNLVDQLSALRDDWSNEDVFQVARLITISVYKNIHYKEALRSMLGDNMSQVADLKFKSDTKSSSSRSMQRMELTEAEWDQGKRPWNPFQTRPDKKRVKAWRMRQEQERLAEAEGFARRQRTVCR